MLCVTHLSEHPLGAGLFCVCIDLVRLFKTCIYSYSKLQSWICLGYSVHRRFGPVSSISYRIPR